MLKACKLRDANWKNKTSMYVIPDIVSLKQQI